MKQILIPKPNLEIHSKFNKTQNQSLQILSYSNDELLTYLKEQASHNPYLQHYTSSNEIDSDAFLEYNHSTQTLFDEIMDQVKLSKYNPNIDVCEYLIMQLDSNGYFKNNYQTLLKEKRFPTPLIKRTIAILRTFEPFGCFAFSLKECLQIQCKLSDHIHKENAFILCSYLEDLALQKWNKVKEETHLSDDQIEEAYAFIKKLNPKPGANYTQNAIYINPEFKIEIIENKMQVSLLNSDLQISFSVEEVNNESEEIREYIKKQREEVKNIMTYVQKRNTTLLQIMQCICEIQSDFFLKNENLNHCTLDIISKMCGLHISTVSRSIANKSCEFNNQYYPLKTFMSSGGVHNYSTQQLKDKIVKYIEEENKSNPYSDEKLKKLLAKEGIPLSRRAIAKYREECFIFNSTKRKRR